MPSLDPAFTIHSGCTVTPHIAGPAYFAALKARLDALGTGDTASQFIYISGWWLSAAFPLDGGTLVDMLKAKAKAGVDVRVLGWVMAPEILQNSRATGAPQLQGMLHINGQTMNFINALRAEPRLANKACLNILAHPAGAVHVKMAVVGSAGDAAGFTGGIDFEGLRKHPIWHDVQAQVTGPAVQGLFETFRQMWNEVRGRSVVRLSARGVSADSHTTSMPDLPARTLTSPSSGHCKVQSLRTVPQMRFSSNGLIASLGGARIPTNKPLSFAPTGLFEIKAAWQRGIQGAQTYIYIEDQGFSSTEVLTWVRDAVKANDNVKAVILTGQVDPNDGATVPIENNPPFRRAINQLFDGLNPAQQARVGVFKHQTKTIHTKSTIVDDAWAIIGSANCMRRSLYTDFEHSVAYVDDEGKAVDAYRRDLWGIHLKKSLSTADGLTAWFALPFQGSGPVPAAGIMRLHAPFPAVTMSAADQVLYDEVLDADSRQEWGGRLIDFYMKQYGAGSLSGGGGDDGTTPDAGGSGTETPTPVGGATGGSH